MSGNDIYLTEILTSTGCPWMSEFNVRNWHILNQFSDIHTGPILWHSQNLCGMSGYNVSNWCLQNTHRTCSGHQELTSVIDLNWTSPDIHRTSLGCEDSMTDSHLSWTRSLMSPGCLYDIRAWHRYLTYPGQWSWCQQAIVRMSVLTWPK